MSKRFADHDEVSDPKRQKPNGVAPDAAETVNSARQLQQLLSFEQDSAVELRHGTRAFKAFLESILYAPDKTSTVGQQSILKEYLQSQTPQRDSDKEAPVLPSLMQAWSFAAQANNDTLLSAIPSVLALLLKTISGLIDFREQGLELCKSLLQTSQLKLIASALAAPKHKEHIISPCLRLLTEIVSFDGGTLARRVFAAKAFTFDGKMIGRNLSLWKAATADPKEDKRKPAVRTNAVRYVLACIRFMSGSAKAETLKYGNVMRALLEYLRHDPVNIMKEILDTMKAQVLLDDTIPASIKRHILNDHTLGHVASIYREEKADHDPNTEELHSEKIAHVFMSFVCSDARAGLLRPYAGWYPPGTDRDSAEGEYEDDVAEIDLGLDSVEWYNRYQNGVSVRNATLSKFAQTLRPHASVLENELLIKIFESAPELVADYFFRKSTFAFDPKLTATWIGYSSFLFSTVQLPVPVNLGRKDAGGRIPPPASIVIESILPQPLTQKILTRCLNQNIELITFFAIRLVCIACQKLRGVLAQFKQMARSEGSLWDEGAARVVDEFNKRCPRMKDVIATFRKTPSDNLLQREGVLRLISLYYEVIPQAALEEKFDVSTTLADALQIAEEMPETCSSNNGVDTPKEVDQSRLQLLTLSHLLQIAHRTPDMKWWNKPEPLKLSPFMTLLKIAVQLSRENLPEDMYLLIDFIIKENGILQQDTEIPGLHALLASLTPTDKFKPSDALHEFIDDAFARVIRKPIKYEDDFDLLSDTLNSRKKIGPVSLFMMTLAEQWPFAAERSESSGNIAFWLGRYVLSSQAIGEDKKLLGEIHDGMVAAAKHETDRQCLTSHMPIFLLKDISNLHLPEKAKPKHDNNTNQEDNISNGFVIDFDAFGPPAEDPKHRGLHRWSSKDIPSAVADGDLAALILCLSSEYREVREMALANLRQFAKNLDATKSTYPDAEQIYLLVGLLINTVTPILHPPTTNGRILDHVNEDNEEEEKLAVPYFCTVYAVLALHILQDPLHPLYPKINDFHTRSPKWDISRLPSYWTHQILFTPPTPSYSTAPSTATTSFSSSAQSKIVLRLSVTTTTTTVSSSATTSSTTTGIATADETALLTSSSPDALASALRSPHHFLLTYIHHALRTPADLALLRARGTLEPLFALANNPFLPTDLLARLLGVVARVSCLPGGSTTLVTRKGGIAWLGALACARATAAAVGSKPGRGATGKDVYVDMDTLLTSERGVRMLLRRVWETCDRDYVDRWSDGGVADVVERVAPLL